LILFLFPKGKAVIKQAALQVEVSAKLERQGIAVKRIGIQGFKR